MTSGEEEIHATAAPENEAAIAKKSLSEINMALDVEGQRDFDFDAEARYVITDTGIPNDEKVRELIEADSTLGFEVVKMDGLPTITQNVGGREVSFYQYKGQLINPTIKALLVDRSQPDVDKDGKAVVNFKGMRADEVIDPAVIADRLGKKVSYSVSVDAEGKLSISNPDAATKVTVLGFGDAKLASQPVSAVEAPAITAPVAEVEVQPAAPNIAPVEVAESAPADAYEGAIAAAKLVTELEAEIDKSSAEISVEKGVESHEPLTVEEFKEMGDKGLDAVDVDNPAEVAEAAAAQPEVIEPASAAEVVEAVPQTNESEAMHSQYESRVMDIRVETASELARALNALEENQNLDTLGNRTIVDSAGEAVSRLNAVLRNYNDYPVGSIQTEIRQTVDALYSVHAATRRFGEWTLGEIRSATSAIEAVLARQSQDAENVDANFQVALAERGLQPDQTTETAADAIKGAGDTISGVQELRQSLNSLDTVMGNLSQSVLRRRIDELESVLQQPINPEDLMQITRSIQLAFDNDDIRGSITDANTKLQAVIDQTRQARSKLHPAGS